MPPGGVAKRADQLSTLRRIAHVRFTGNDVGRLLDDAENAVGTLPFDSDEASLVRVTRRDYDDARELPPDLVAEVAHAGATARPVWEKACKFGSGLRREIDRRARLAVHLEAEYVGPAVMPGNVEGSLGGRSAGRVAVRIENPVLLM